MNTAVSLVRYAKLPELGWRRGAAVVGKTGKVKPDYMWLGGVGSKQVYAPDGYYQLRIYRGSKPNYINVGKDATEALNRQKEEEKLQELRNAGKVPELEGKKKTLGQYRDAFLERNSGLSQDSVQNYRFAVNRFLSICHCTFPGQVTEDDVIRFGKSMDDAGYAPRTRMGRYTNLRAFLRYCGIDLSKLISTEINRRLKKVTKTEVETYTEEQITTLIQGTASDRHKLLWEFLWKTGFRMQEAKYLTWACIDWNNRTVSVKRQPNWKFEPKDSEERTVPMSAGLLQNLKEWHKTHSKAKLVFGNDRDNPDSHFLEALKHWATVSKINCGQCGACSAKKGCEHVFLHKFRATFCTTLLQSGLDIRTVMKLMGHSDLESTMRYLRPATGNVMQEAVNNAFD